MNIDVSSSLMHSSPVHSRKKKKNGYRCFHCKWFGTLFDHLLFSITHITNMTFNWQFMFDRFERNMFFLYLRLIVNIHVCALIYSLFFPWKIAYPPIPVVKLCTLPNLYGCCIHNIFLYMRILGEVPGKSACMGTCTHCVYPLY